MVELNEADEGIVDLLRDGRNTPSNLARHLDYSREYVSQRLKRLTEHDVVERVDRGLYELVDDPAETTDAETPQAAEEPPRREANASQPLEPSADERTGVPTEDGFEESDVAGEFDLPNGDEITDDVWSTVNEVSANWEDDAARLETRRKAAATVLQYALDHDVYLGKSSDVVEAVHERYPVEGQNAETWWRKNIRAVLKEVGTYSQGHHGYAVEGLADA
jgi:DNA-binding transcriptional ArsR family regulator